MTTEEIHLEPLLGDLGYSCIFTGVQVTKQDGEHVLPKWMRNAYNLHQQPIEMGQTERFAKVHTFRAPAEPVANGDFGKVEARVKQQDASLDELHLWSKKISVGMIWNHWRLSGNSRHPHAPLPFDERHLRFVLQDFQEEFVLWRERQYVRTGSTVKLATGIEGVWLLHAFGATVDEGYSITHDLIKPYGYTAINYKKNLIVSSFYDGQTLETGPFLEQWASAGLDKETDQVRIRAGLAKIFAQHAATEISKLVGKNTKVDELHRLLAYQLGIIVSDDGKTYRPRMSEDV